MLLPFERFIDTPVMSLQTGSELARTRHVLVDPRDLTIVAYELDGPMLDQRPSYLRPVDVRELSTLGLIVDSSDEFVGIDDVIRIRQVVGFNFDLRGLDVIDEKKKKLGRIQSFNIDSESFSVQQLVVKRPLLKSFGEAELLISRTQVVEVRETHVTVKLATTDAPAKASLREIANPFRTTSSVQPEAIDFESRWH